MADESTSTGLAIEIDEIDRQLLHHLQENGRTTNAALAEAVGLTATPVLQRIKKLEQAGVIVGYTALVDAAAVGLAATAFVHVKLAQHKLDTHERFLAAIYDYSEVLECHHIAGEHDFLLKVVVASIREFEHFLLHRLTSIADIDRVKTTFVLSTAKASTALPVVDDEARKRNLK